MEENGFGSNDSNAETTTTASDTTVNLFLQRKRTTMLELLSNRHHSQLAGKSVLDSTTLNVPPSFKSTQSFLLKFSQSKVYIESCLSQIHQQQENKVPGSDSKVNRFLAVDRLLAGFGHPADAITTVSI
ncbi:tubulin-folding cofactor C [Forsythia ovata]|uniref:Tubulin-folding cofactor C n=1 Tax=Forsythia ovata TaxID=205694 RepID=A0ABD1W931_9LAMI